MATQLFKDGQSVWVEALQVNAHIESGWSVTDESEIAEDVSESESDDSATDESEVPRKRGRPKKQAE